MRIWDAIKVAHAMSQINGEHVDPIEWLANPVNIALENEHGDLALFEYGLPQKQVYSGHYIFKSRGRQAINAARDFLDEIFNSCYNISILMGLTPKENRAASWISRRVGFTSYGFEEIHGKEYELFILTKKEFNNG
jgi:hypothetical protein